MEERQDNTKNIKLIRQRIKEDKIKDLISLVKQSQTKVNSISKLLTDKENEIRRKASEEILAQQSEQPVEVKTDDVSKKAENRLKKQQKLQSKSPLLNLLKKKQ